MQNIDTSSDSAANSIFDKSKGIPIGSRVRICGGLHRGAPKARYYVGQEAIVVSQPRPNGFGNGPGFKDVVSVRFFTPNNDWEINENFLNVEPEHLEVLTVGDGTALPGIAYRLCEKEIWDARFRAHNFEHEGYSNQPTFLAVVYLKQDSTHVEALRGMLRKDMTLNPVRLKKYFNRDSSLQLDEGADFVYPFPERSEYRLLVDWQEVASDFEAQFIEDRDFLARQEEATC